jgi:hypothetical protein
MPQSIQTGIITQCTAWALASSWLFFLKVSTPYVPQRGTLAGWLVLHRTLSCSCAVRFFFLLVFHVQGLRPRQCTPAPMLYCRRLMTVKQRERVRLDDR